MVVENYSGGPAMELSDVVEDSDRGVNERGYYSPEVGLGGTRVKDTLVCVNEGE